MVGLHRAAYLARTRPGKVLVTSFVKTLPGVLSELLTRLAPEVVDRIEFTGVHSFASKLLRKRGVTFKLDLKAADLAFAKAWQQVGAGSNLDTGKKDQRYWNEEIQHVLKGRGITQYGQYADWCAPDGATRWDRPSGRRCGSCIRPTTRNCAPAGVIDYADLILLAETELRREPLTDYAAVIVDEAQDLSAAMVRMLYSLVGDRPDGFTLIGDGQQSIYPGGYTLAEVGISVQNRGVVLDVNYRNTAEIVAFAQQLVSGDEYATSRGRSPAVMCRPAFRAAALNGDRLVLHLGRGASRHGRSRPAGDPRDRHRRGRRGRAVRDATRRRPRDADSRRGRRSDDQPGGLRRRPHRRREGGHHQAGQGPGVKQVLIPDVARKQTSGEVPPTTPNANAGTSTAASCMSP